MASDYRIINDTLFQYIESVSPVEPDLLNRLRQETSELPRGVMQIHPLQGQFMTLLIKSINAVKAIEIGVFTGYSSLCIAEALPEHGMLVACDISKEWTTIAQRYWEAAKIEHKVDLKIAPAVDSLDALLADGHADTFDFVFIDADKESYEHYYERSLRLLRPGGVIMVDNVLWKGLVLDPSHNDIETQCIREFNTKRKHDSRVDVSLLPVGDGVTLLRKRENGHATQGDAQDG